MGSVFSPRYFAAKQAGVYHEALAHCAVNAVLYRRRQGRWVMTQVPRGQVERSGEHLRISNSQVSRSGSKIRIDLNEKTALWGQSFRGCVELEILGGLDCPRALDRALDHAWWPVGAQARARVCLDAPQLTFSGSAYHDCNFGQVPLEATFERWTWSRSELESGVAILYDTVEIGGHAAQLGLHLGKDGELGSVSAHCEAQLGKGVWGTADVTRSDGEHPVKILRRLEDTPFYNRSLLQTSLMGERCVAVHESLDLQRFTQKWVQFLLPFRIRNAR